jgi:outer membrane protein assembly factor BamD (BamD/ComL family)
MRRSIGVLIVLVMIFGGGCATDKGLWHKAQKENTIQAYNDYLAKYPQGDFADKVRERRDYLIELQAYRRANQINSLETYRDFLKEFPDGYFADIVRDRKIEALEDEAWRQTEQAGTVEAIDSFLLEFPNGRYEDKAQQKRDQIVEDRDWDNACYLDTIQSYDYYLKHYPTGRYADHAREKRRYWVRDAEAWDHAKELHTLRSYYSYLNKFPNGKYITEARQACEVIKKREAEAWAKTQEANTVESYANYLKSYPTGRYVREAMEKKARLVEELVWRRTKQSDTFKGYADYLSSYPRGKYAGKARLAIPKFYLLSDAQITQIGKWQRAKNSKAKRLDNVEKLLFTGANCLNSGANWTNRSRGRQVYDILKKYNSQLLAKAMTRVVLMEIDRLRVLFLVVKLGVPGTQKPLNDLLLEYGNKSMAEDYLNSGSKELYEGGKAWASANGYWISTGWGSSRVSWGGF